MISPTVKSYAITHSSKTSSFLYSLSKETYLKTQAPNMLTSAWQGRLLSLISKIISPKYILELGTFTGYSTLCLSEGLAKEGITHSIDNNLSYKEIRENYIANSEYSSNICFHHGKALDIIPTLNLVFDLVYIDADKKNYLNYYKMLMLKIRKGGVILADNVLWRGKVADNYLRQNDKITQSLHDFNTFVAEDERVEKIIMPIEDGLTLIRKL